MRHNDATTASNCPTNDNSYQDVIDIGANYLNKFGDVTVALFGAFMYANFVPSFNNLAANNANTVTGANLAPWKQWVVGVQFGFAGFTVGGSYGYDNNGIGGNYYTGQASESRKWAASIMYETGPWQMSFGWGHVNTDNGNGATPARDGRSRHHQRITTSWPAAGSSSATSARTRSRARPSSVVTSRTSSSSA